MQQSHEQTINQLRTVAQRSPVMADVLHVFAARKRARSQISVRALSMRMEQEGFKYKANEYVSVLKVLSDSGVGSLRRNIKGQVTALTNIKITLQSLGKSVLGKSQELKALNLRNKFSSLTPVAEMIKAEKPAAKELQVYPYRATSSISITLTINKKPVIIPLPSTLTPEEIAGLIKHFQRDLDTKEEKSRNVTNK